MDTRHLPIPAELTGSVDEVLDRIAALMAAGRRAEARDVLLDFAEDEADLAVVEDRERQGQGAPIPLETISHVVGRISEA